MDLPLTAFDAVYHIGSLEPQDKGKRGSSLEGHGLSFAPSERLAEEWERIAKLGGFPWWRLECDGAAFVDAHRLSKAQRKGVVDWGLQEGYVERVTVYHAVRYDDELDEETWFVCATREEAELEVDSEEGGEVRRRRDLKGTAKLDELVGQESGLNCFDLLLVAYVQETTPYAGLYWNDAVDGWYSAPRGVILPGKVADWQVEKILEPKPRLSHLEQQTGPAREPLAPSLDL